MRQRQSRGNVYAPAHKKNNVNDIKKVIEHINIKLNINNLFPGLLSCGSAL